MVGLMKKSIFLILITILAAFSLLFSQSADYKVKAIAESGGIIELYKGCYALVIGISDYLSGWPDLPDAENYADDIGDFLASLEFTVTKLKNPTKNDLVKSLENFIYGPGQNPDNCLVIFFSGHGCTQKFAYGSEIGFIVPRDAPLPEQDSAGFMQNAIDMPTIETYARKLQAKHVLFIFDCCLSTESFFMYKALPTALDQKTAMPVRQLITAGKADNPNPDRRIFNSQLIKGLKGEADLNGDGYLTGTELGKFLQDKVAIYSRNTQQPQYGKIRDPNLDRGDFVFDLKQMSAAKAGEAPSAPSPMPSKALSQPVTRKTGPETLPSIRKETFEFVQQMEFFDSKGEQIKSSEGMCIDKSGLIYLADTLNSRVLKFASDGKLISEWGSKGSELGEFSSPRGIAIDSSGCVYVADKDNNRVQKFTKEGDFVSRWGSFGTDNGKFKSPTKIAIDDKGYVYVTDSGNDRIQKFNLDGKFITVWGSRGGGDGQFLYPEGIAVDNSGYVYVSDSGNDRIQKFTSDGKFVLKWGIRGYHDGEFNFPEGIVVDSFGFIYVADTWNYRVQKFTPKGLFMGKWGSRGSKSGDFYEPVEVAIDPEGATLVLDPSNHRMQKFRIALMAEGQGKKELPEIPKKVEKLPLKEEKREAQAEDIEPVIVSEGMIAPAVINRVNPVYPMMASAARIEGSVILEVTTDREGNVEEVRVLTSTNKLLNQAAIDAVRKWSFEPFLVKGQPRKAKFPVKIKFSLKGK